MKNLSINLIAAASPNAFYDSLPIVRIVLISLIILLSAFLIVLILLQPAKQEGVGAISGSTDTFFSKNKGRTREGMLMRMTIVVSIVIFVLVLLYFISLSIYSPEDPFGQNAAEAIVKSALRK